eukprot:1376523-Rhodomonas_salina.1
MEAVLPFMETVLAVAAVCGRGADVGGGTRCAAVGFKMLTCIQVTWPAIRLQACYAMSGTEPAYGAISLRACYAICSPELAYE